MATSDVDLSSKLQHIILNTRVPLVLPKFQTDWPCFKGTLGDWCQLYDANAESLPVFERMQLDESHTPQWERKRKQLAMTTAQLLKEHEKEQPYWTAYHYKRALELPKSSVEGIDFKRFGFAEHNNDFTFWLGSKGANTPCHYDTFGVNVVVQVYGQKSWLLFPAETRLQSIRVPYEESSIYCQENFYAPNPVKLASYEQHASQAYYCVLNPGDVLIVPRHWWHYVEAMQTSLSVNHWVPLKIDLDLAFDEVIVKHLVESFVKNESEELKSYLLNPNQLEEIVKKPSELFMLFEEAVKNAEDALGKRKLYETDYIKQVDLIESLKSLENIIKPLEIMPKKAFAELLENNAKRYNEKSTEMPIINPMLELLINSMCAPKTIAQIKREYFERLQRDKIL